MHTMQLSASLLNHLVVDHLQLYDTTTEHL